MEVEVIVEEHKGPVFEIPDRRRFAYQSETVLVGGEFILKASDPTHLDTHKWRNQLDCRGYELKIANHTGTCVIVDLTIKPSDSEVDQGKKPWSLSWSGSFAELCNRLFGPGCEKYDFE